MLLAALAFADPMDTAAGDMAPCQSHLGDSAPADGATRVPLDVSMVVEVADPTCEPGQWSLALYRDGLAEPLTSSEQSVRLGFLELTPSAQLDPFTGYRLEVTDAFGDGISAEYGFTTGDATADPSEWTVTIADLRAEWHPSESRLVVTSMIEVPLGQPDGILVRAGESDGTGGVSDWEAEDWGFGGAETYLSWITFLDEDPRDLCIVAQGRNLDGSWTDARQTCVATTEALGDTGSEGNAGTGCMCNSAGALRGGAVPVLALAAALRRRRR
jgi:hypothetical protein